MEKTISVWINNPSFLTQIRNFLFRKSPKNIFLACEKAPIKRPALGNFGGTTFAQDRKKSISLSPAWANERWN
jgi:hypothetical protein